MKTSNLTRETGWTGTTEIAVLILASSPILTWSIAANVQINGTIVPAPVGLAVALERFLA